MLLAIDRGNTNDKFVIFDDDKIVFDSKTSNDVFKNTDNCLKNCDSRSEKLITQKNSAFSVISELITQKNFSVNSCIFSSVKSEEENRKFLSLASKYFPTSQVTTSTPLPFENLYKSKSLGTDRICAVAGAKALFGINVLVIDVGTCITFDYLDAENRYLGGSISPSFRIKFEALHNFTANLPLITDIDDIDLVGQTTECSIKSGVINGTIAEIEQVINLYKQRFDNVKIVITGGDSGMIAQRISHKVITEKNLVFWGLKNIYTFNEKKNI